jgi:hypothetical protein
MNRRTSKVASLVFAIAFSAGLASQAFSESEEVIAQISLVSVLTDSGLYNQENAINYVSKLTTEEVSVLLNTLKNSNLSQAQMTHAFSSN